MSFYRFCMTKASAILFVISIIVFIQAAWSVLVTSSDVFGAVSQAADNVAFMRINSVVGAFSAGLGAASLPFAFAALLFAMKTSRLEAAE
ncbi:hypothetical protein [Qipengyuania sp. JC766]|uniref:hypothetical protein n=1 Tax=Qipengyuania sp. JC766 TaxID=3232139 RepID=UPI0034599901